MQLQMGKMVRYKRFLTVLVAWRKPGSLDWAFEPVGFFHVSKVERLGEGEGDTGRFQHLNSSLGQDDSGGT